MRVGPTRACDLSTHKELSQFGSLPLNDIGLAIHPRGHQAVVPGVVPGVGPTVEVWEPSGGKLLHREPLPFLFAIRMAAYSPDGAHFATVGSRGPVRIWSSTDFKEVRSLQGDGDPVGLAWSKGGLLALRTSNGVKVWEASTGRAVAELADKTFGVGPVTFSPDGKQIATANHGGVVTLWTPNSDQPPRRLTGHTSSVTGVAFSPDGKRLASCGQDSCVKLWDPGAGEELLTLRGGGGFLCVAFSPDGKKIYAGTEGGIRIWEGGRRRR
jgi:WD40 repeat protein